MGVETVGSSGASPLEFEISVNLTMGKGKRAHTETVPLAVSCPAGADRETGSVSLAIPGLAHNQTTYNSVRAEFGDRLDLCSVDLPGHGQTPTLSGSVFNRLRTQHYVAALQQAVPAIEQRLKRHVGGIWGHSMAGFVLLKAISEDPALKAGRTFFLLAPARPLDTGPESGRVETVWNNLSTSMPWLKPLLAFSYKDPETGKGEFRPHVYPSLDGMQPVFLARRDGQAEPLSTEDLETLSGVRSPEPLLPLLQLVGLFDPAGAKINWDGLAGAHIAMLAFEQDAILSVPQQETLQGRLQAAGATVTLTVQPDCTHDRFVLEPKRCLAQGVAAFLQASENQAASVIH